MSSSDTILFVAAIAGAAALFATKPSETDIEKLVNEMIYADIKNTKADDMFSGVMKFACSSYSNECIQLIRTTMDVNIDDNILWQSVKITQGNNKLNCLGILNKLSCPNFLNDDENNSAQPSNSEGSDYLTCIFNKTSSVIYFSYRWGDQGNWENTKLEKGDGQWFSNKGTALLNVSFDADPADGRQEATYTLERKASSTKDCDSAKKYNFQWDGNSLKLYHG